MPSVIFSYLTIFVFISIQTVVLTFSTKDECVEGIVKLVKEKHSELATLELRLSNVQSSDSLQQICKYYVPHRVHKVLTLVNPKTCDTEIPTTSELETSIYDSYVSLLKQLATYEGLNIPNSFGQHNDRTVAVTNAMFDRTAERLSGICLHKNVEDLK